MKISKQNFSLEVIDGYLSSCLLWTNKAITYLRISFNFQIFSGEIFPYFSMTELKNIILKPFAR